MVELLLDSGAGAGFWNLLLGIQPAVTAYHTKKRFEDVAYFEPFYLKEFVATVSKKKMW